MGSSAILAITLASPHPNYPRGNISRQAYL
nr:MAG TPA: hypothetical protein [Caudoviricetes sp.]